MDGWIDGQADGGADNRAYKIKLCHCCVAGYKNGIKSTKYMLYASKHMSSKLINVLTE